ncbi:hypothetical protein I5U65_00380 [Stenotrophomonas maltophilia]|nr:hypothetical protein [Stenotrophomonas maltophilia]
MTSSLQEITELANLTMNNALTEGSRVWDEMEEAARPEMLWIHHLLQAHPDNQAQSLLKGASVSIPEAAGCLSLGLVRPALNSLRAQIDLCLAWIYFKDHPVELRVIQTTGDGFKLKKEILDYFTNWYPDFGRRWGILKQRARRTHQDPYRILSAHMHAQSEIVIPNLEKLTDMVGSKKVQREAVMLQAECSEYLSDIFWCIFADDHMTIPAELKDQLLPRFATAKERAEFFKNC